MLLRTYQWMPADHGDECEECHEVLLRTYQWMPADHGDECEECHEVRCTENLSMDAS